LSWLPSDAAGVTGPRPNPSKIICELTLFVIE
jgi:hypothetical protein